MPGAAFFQRNDTQDMRTFLTLRKGCYYHKILIDHSILTGFQEGQSELFSNSSLPPTRKCPDWNENLFYCFVAPP